MNPDMSAPVYACLYPQFAKIARNHGYALAAHGTLGQDVDLICVPWTDAPSAPQDVVDDFVTLFTMKQVGQPCYKPHSRLAYTLSTLSNDRPLALSFTPITRSALKLT